MIVLHAGVEGGQLLLWGETPLEPAPPRPGRCGHAKRGRLRTAPPLLPYDAGAERLLAALGEAGIGFKANRGRTETVIVWLPTVDGTPVPSSPLIAEPPRSRAKAILAPWMITALRLSPEQAVTALLASMGKRVLAPGVIVGKDLMYWAMVLRFAGALVARQQFLPSVIEEHGSYQACWQPVFVGADADRLMKLAKAMPAVSRALSREAISPPEAPSASVLSEFLGGMVDHLVRSALPALPLPLRRERRRKKGSAFDSLHDQWLSALRAADGVMEGEQRELAAFYAQVREWQRPIAISTATPFRLCFRLEEPHDNGEDGGKVRPGRGPWYNRYLLQATDDPSLLIPAKDAWGAKGYKASILKRGGFNAKEYLLSSLGQASGICPRIEASLKTAAPDGYELDTTGAYEFLTQTAPILEQAGFGVLLPTWWTRKGAKLRLTARAHVKSPTMQGRSGLSLDTIIRFDWEVALGDQTLSLEELQALAKLKVPLVKVRGQWVEVNAEELQATIALMRKKGSTPVREIVQMALGAGKAPGGMAVNGVKATGWIADLLAQLEGRAAFEELPHPKGFQGTLRPYQVRGYSWLSLLRNWGLGACLADDMGLGKCILADSLVAVNGTLQTAEVIWDSYAGETEFDGEGFWAIPTEPLFVNAMDEETGRITLAPIRRLYRQHVREKLRRVRLEDGSSITITRPHRLLTNKGWTNDLQVGDYICVPAKMVWDGQPEDPDLVKFLAWQMAEGYEQPDRATVSITQKGTEQLEDLLQTFRRISQRYGIKINHPSIHAFPGKAPALVVNSHAYRRFLEAKGYCWGKLSREKSFPPFIMQADLDSVRLFLRNFFDAEASVVPSMRSIEISSASSLLLQQLSFLLRRFGIWLRISTKQKRATNGTGILRTSSIGVIGGNSARRFLKEIGFGNPEKQRRLEEICKKVSNTNVEGIPASDLVAQAVRATGLPVRHFGMHNTVYINGSQQFSRASLERVLVEFDRILNGEAAEQYRRQKPSKWTARTLGAYAHLDVQQLSVTRQRLQRLFDQEVFYCKIEALEDVEYEGWVYDFEVAGRHNFVADNILCHNTIQTLALIQREWESDGNRPVLLVCPTSVIGNWQKEAARFTPGLPVMVHHGLTRAKDKTFIEEVGKQAIVIVSYALLHRDVELLKEVPWAGVILDEAQNIKNPETKQAKAARALRADYRIALTGTPVENNVGDLWSIMEFLNPGLLGPQTDFKRRFFVPIQVYRDVEAAERLKRLTGPFILRRLKTDTAIIQDLPGKMEMKVFCTLTKEQASLYQAVVNEATPRLDSVLGIQRRGLILATLSKLKQICNHPAQFLGDNSQIPGRSGKLARLTEMLEEILEVGDRALVFTQFAEMGEILRRHLIEAFGREVLFLHGGVPKGKRDLMVERFQTDREGPPIFVLSLKAGGFGLNLTRANHVFHFDRWWNPAVENQATDRVFRIGQTKNVQVHKFLCLGTLEEKIDEIIERKKEIAQGVVGTGEGWLTELSTAELKAIFALRKEAVGE